MSHIIIEIDPNATYAWNRCAIRGLFSHEEINLQQLVQQQLDKPGHYLAKVSLSVEVLEFNPKLEPEVLEREEMELEEVELSSFEIAA